MKLTWFGGTTLRVYFGGEIVVVDPEGAPEGIDPGELLAGADRVVGLVGDAAVPMVDPAMWRPAVVRPLDEAPPVEIGRLGESGLLISATGEAPLVILAPGPLPRFGRWADGGVVVLTSGEEPLLAEVTALLDVARLRLVALAVDEQALDGAIAALSEHLAGAGLVSLDPGLALEV